MTRPATTSHWRRRWLSWHAIRLHVTLLIVVPGCLAAGWFELTRATAGNELSWVYVFEWPCFAGFAGYLWWTLLRAADQPGGRSGESREQDAASAGLAARAASPAAGPADPELMAWREYLARLHAQSPPGGPPARRPNDAITGPRSPSRRRKG